MDVIRSISKIRKKSLEIQSRGKSIALVPTMGSLHDGHLALIDYAKKKADIVVVSIFVNPTQFNEIEDFNRYPRNENQDIDFCLKKFADIVFIPEKKEILNKMNVWVYEDELSNLYCGKFRPGHFKGVCTIVLKLFNLVEPNMAIFGQKDFQQLKIIKKMVDDLNLSVDIISHPIIREDDGLAMSSRNKLLSTVERKSATKIYKLLKNSAKAFEEGEKNSNQLINLIKFSLKSNDTICLEYVDIVDYYTFKKVNLITSKSVIIIAVRVGNVRLIDNIILEK